MILHLSLVLSAAISLGIMDIPVIIGDINDDYDDDNYGINQTLIVSRIWLSVNLSLCFLMAICLNCCSYAYLPGMQFCNCNAILQLCMFYQQFYLRSSLILDLANVL